MENFNEDDLNKINKKMEEIEKALENILNFKDISRNPVSFDHVKQLGEPDEIERFEEGGFTFEKKTWYKEKGDFVLVELIEEEHPLYKRVRKPLSKQGKQKLEERLQDAVDDENYELAGRLRDMIKEGKNE